MNSPQVIKHMQQKTILVSIYFPTKILSLSHTHLYIFTRLSFDINICSFNPLEFKTF